MIFFYSSSALSVLLHLKCTILEVQNCAVVLHQHGEDLLLLGAILRGAPVYISNDLHIKIFFLRLWPWISQQKTNSRSCLIDLISCLVK